MSLCIFLQYLFTQDFEDITVGFLLDGKKKSKKNSDLNLTKEPALDGRDPELEPDLDLEAVNLTPDEMNEVCRLHRMAFTDLITTQWHQRSTRDCEDQITYIDPIVSGYQMAAQVGRKFWLLIGQ